MGTKCRRKRLAKAVDHFKAVEPAIHTTQFYDLEWLQGQVKAAVRLAKEVDAVLAVYEEDLTKNIQDAMREVLNANN